MSTKPRPTSCPPSPTQKLTALPISAEQRFAVKGVPYTVAELLDDAQTARRYEGRLVSDLPPRAGRLSPLCLPRRRDAVDPRAPSPGVLHTVNPIAADLKVYRRNARRWTVLQTAHFGQVVQMEVGALLVGRIRNHCETPASFGKLQEKGYFEYGGSTVILLLPPGCFEAGCGHPVPQRAGHRVQGAPRGTDRNGGALKRKSDARAEQSSS